MSILRIACGVADVGIGGYTFNTVKNFDPERVLGAFLIENGGAFILGHDAPAATTTWYHFRMATGEFGGLASGSPVRVIDANSNILAQLEVVNGTQFRISARGTTTASSGYVTLGLDTPYSIDIQVIVGATTTVRWYINAALYGEQTVTTGAGFDVARGMNVSHSASVGEFYFSEIIIADEDTRGMRVRELRPTSFGIFQEWDGSITALRDADLATGISTNTADRRVSFGVSNLQFIQPGDVINRVVAQSYAQKGETGLSKFNHFFRYRDTTTEDGVDQVLSTFGDYYLEEFPLNPQTGLAWDPDDFRSLQTGVRSRA
jgi:hypothetical protein